MKYFTLALPKNDIKMLLKVYQNHLLNIEKPFVTFIAKHNFCTITAYNSGKVVISGENITPEIAAIKNHLGIKDYEAIGSDEVGTGDLFGPVVVTSTFTSLDDLKYLEDLGVRDSKTLSDAKILVLGPLLAKRLVHKIIILSPERYNNATKKGYNLNKIKAILHNKAIIEVTSLINKDVPVILDQFCRESLYFNYLKEEKFVFRNSLEFHTKAEEYHLAVAASSIIARYVFLVSLKEYSSELKMNFIKGASVLATNLAKEIFVKLGLDELNKVAKMNFKNIKEKIL